MNTELFAATASRNDRANPVSLFISLIRENPADGIEVHKRKLRDLLLKDGYEDFLDAVIDEWQRIKYSTAYSAALPPTVAEVSKKQAAKREIKAKAQADHTAATKAAKNAIGARLFNMLMPNGKPLNACTGAECTAFGSFYSRIGASLQPGEIVSDKFDCDSLAKLMQKVGG